MLSLAIPIPFQLACASHLTAGFERMYMNVVHPWQDDISPYVDHLGAVVAVGRLLLVRHGPFVASEVDNLAVLYHHCLLCFWNPANSHLEVTKVFIQVSSSILFTLGSSLHLRHRRCISLRSCRWLREERGDTASKSRSSRNTCPHSPKSSDRPGRQSCVGPKENKCHNIL